MVSSTIFSSDQQLIAAFAEGSETAFTVIYDRFYLQVYQYARRCVSSRQEAEDITSESFIKMLERRRQFLNIDNVLAFLKVTTRNACLNFLKHLRVRSTKQAELLQLMQSQPEPDFTWVQVRQEFLNLIYAEVDKLPEKMREIFLLSYKEGLKPVEIAEKLRLSMQTVSNQKSNALRLLRDALGSRALFVFLTILLQEGK